MYQQQSVLGFINTELAAVAAIKGEAAKVIMGAKANISGLGDIQSNVVDFTPPYKAGYQGSSIGGVAQDYTMVTINGGLQAFSLFSADQLDKMNATGNNFKVKIEYLDADKTAIATAEFEGSLTQGTTINNAKGSYGVVGGKQEQVGDAA